jgi:hypothetical protein
MEKKGYCRDQLLGSPREPTGFWPRRRNVPSRTVDRGAKSGQETRGIFHDSKPIPTHTPTQGSLLSALPPLPLLHNQTDLLTTSPPRQFGTGSRTCIGKNISLMEISKAVPQLVRHFEFDPGNESRTPEWRTENVWFIKPRDLHCRIWMHSENQRNY